MERTWTYVSLEVWLGCENILLSFHSTIIHHFQVQTLTGNWEVVIFNGSLNIYYEHDRFWLEKARNLGYRRKNRIPPQPEKTITGLHAVKLPKWDSVFPLFILSIPLFGTRDQIQHPNHECALWYWATPPGSSLFSFEFSLFSRKHRQKPLKRRK